MSALGTRLARLPREVADTFRALRRSGSRVRTDATQIAKATLAAVIAWFVAGPLFGSPAAWLAPMTAVLMVQSTVYRSLAEGLKRVVAVTAGVLLAGAVGALVGLSALGLLILVPLSLLGARLRWINTQGEYIAVTAVLLLTFGASRREPFLLSYVADTAFGVVAGAVVNALLFPPAYQRSARAAVSELARRTASVLREVADGIRSGWGPDEATEWDRLAGTLDGEVEAARSALTWSQEGTRWNPWPRRHAGRPAAHYQPAVDTLEHVAIELQRLTRTLRDTAPVADGAQPDGWLENAPPVYDDLEPLLEVVAEVLDRYGEDPVATPEGGPSQPVRDAANRADELVEDLAERAPQTSVPERGEFAAVGAILQLARRITDHIRQ